MRLSFPLLNPISLPGSTGGWKGKGPVNASRVYSAVGAMAVTNKTAERPTRKWLNVMVVVLVPPLWLCAGYKLTRHPIDLHGKGFIDSVVMLIYVPLTYRGSLRELRKRNEQSREHKQK